MSYEPFLKKFKEIIWETWFQVLTTLSLPIHTYLRILKGPCKYILKVFYHLHIYIYIIMGFGGHGPPSSLAALSLQQAISVGPKF